MTRRLSLCEGEVVSVESNRYLIVVMQCEVRCLYVRCVGSICFAEVLYIGSIGDRLVLDVGSIGVE